MAGSKFVNKISDLPQEAHYAIIRQTSVHVPGDERSRTNPGHGYPASTEYFLTYTAFADRSEWEAEIARLVRSRDAFRAIEVKPVTVTTTVSVVVA